MTNHQTLCGRLVAGLTVLLLLAGTPVLAADVELQWPAEWVFFGPLEKGHPVVDSEQLQTIPERLQIQPHEALTLPGLSLEPERLRVVPGAPVNLYDAIGLESSKTCYVFIELQADQAGEVTFGFGADWWMQCWLNGEEIFNTYVHGRAGNQVSPPAMLNHEVKARVQAGTNILAVRFSRGVATAMLAVGDASHFDAERQRLAELERSMALNRLPETLAERLIFPVEEQAVATASWSIDLTLPEVDLASGALVGLRPMPQRQNFLYAPEGATWQLRDTLQRRFKEPVRLLLSKSRYPWEDRHLDAIVWTTGPEGQPLDGQLEVVLKDQTGQVLARHEIDELPHSGLFFSVGLPQALAGQTGRLETTWRRGERVIGSAEASFRVESPADVATAGRVRLQLLNAPQAVLANAPMTVGVPFPHGALVDDNTVRLVNEAGEEVPLQTKVTARWSRFGPVKWLLCDFTADLDGRPREFFLEYGPDVRRVNRPPMVVTASAGFPVVDAGWLRVDAEGVSVAGTPVLAPGALAGAFVEHENGQRFTVPAEADYAVEELGSEKAVIRRTGWYVDEATGERFCQYVTRFVFHRESSVVRIFHTWIFTGDGNQDRIAEMGWRFATAGALQSEGLLTSFGEGAWADARHLVQHDYDHYRLSNQEGALAGRTPGVLGATVGDSRVFLGIKDFWQNFPNELEVVDGAFTFYNWPAHNPPASHEQPITIKTAYRHRWMHEGELLDFRLPDEYTHGELYAHVQREKYWAENRPESVNAQGVARTEEMFLYLAGTGIDRQEAVAVMQGLNDESIRAVVDPAWICASGVFGNVHPRDTAAYPEDEYIYHQVVRAPARWSDRLGIYGKWLYGEVAAWGTDVIQRSSSLHRMLRKNHHGWPVGWLPFARSGEPELLKQAEAATRQMIDANFCHYADEAVDASVKPDYYRKQGWWIRSALPWAAGPGGRSYTSDCDYIWHAYYLTGYARARDVALLFGEVTKYDHDTTGGPRSSSSLMPSYLDMYQATWDPWFLNSAHLLAELHQHLYAQDQVLDKLEDDSVGHFWRPADQIYERFTGDEAYQMLALNNAIGWSSPRKYTNALWPRLGLPLITQAVYAWEETGDSFHLARAAAYLDWARRGVYDGNVDYGRGSLVQPSIARQTFTGYYIRQFPLALAAFEAAGGRPDPIPNPFFLRGENLSTSHTLFHFELPVVIVRKAESRAVSLVLASEAFDKEGEYYCQVSGPAGQPFLDRVWPPDATNHYLHLPQDAAAGDYRVVLGGQVPAKSEANFKHVGAKYGEIALPVAEPEVPEVVLFPRTEAGTVVSGGGFGVQFWFYVPEGVREFWIEFDGTQSDFNRVSVWNADRQRVWDHSYTKEPADRLPERVTIVVPPGQDGRVWGASGGRFLIDSTIPPYFSTSRVKWFNPER